MPVARRRSLAAGLLALALPLAACGGDDGDAAATPTTAAAAAAGAGTTAAPASSVTVATTGAPSTTARAATTTAAKRSDCLVVAELYNKILMNAGISGNALTADKLAKLKTAVGEVTAAAPADLKAQFTTVGEAFVTAGTNGDKSKLTSAAYTAANDQLAAIVTTC